MNNHRIAILLRQLADEFDPLPTPTRDENPEAPEPEAAPVEHVETEEIELPDIQALALKWIKGGKKEALVALLKKFKIPNISSAPKDQYDTLHAALRKDQP